MSDTASPGPHYVLPQHARSVIEAESALLGVEPENATALAISGGGIRSASFALGVVQALVNAKLMPHVQYVSTVSGGGFFGASLTWFLHKGLPDGTPAGTSPQDFPFGTRSSSRVGHGDGRNQILDYIRQHANYLVPSNALDVASLAAVTLRAMLVSLGVYFGMLTALMSVLWSLRFFDATLPAALGLTALPNAFLLLAAALAASFVLSSLLFSLGTGVLGADAYALRTRAQVVFGVLLKSAFACAVLGALPPLHGWFGELWMAAAGASSTTLGALLGALEAWLQSRGGESTKRGVLATSRPIAAACLVLYGLALGAYALAGMFVAHEHPLGDVAVWSMIVLSTVVGLFVNVNHLGLHRMYRDRLMELFLPNRSAVRKNSWALATEADVSSIERFCQHDGQPVRPYHIINTTVLLVDSPSAGYRGRGGDNFILSPLYCGSTATGWRTSKSYLKRRTRSGLLSGRGMTLPTAMAISGAAVNPNAGVAGAGATRSRVVSTLLAVLNLRLGYWAANPNRKPSARLSVPNFLEPGLRGGVLGGGLREDAAMVQLSDGGHFENLAAYELIRRRVRCILVCDGGQDGAFSFGDLANLTERVRVDFGAKIEFDVEGFGLDGLVPGSAPHDVASVLPHAQLAARGFAVGRIRYAGDPREAPSGTLVYIKGTLTPALSTDLYGYKRENPDFPHQSTGDQFFHEPQFEAYRELGYHLGWQWLEANDKHRFWTPPAPSAPPASRTGQTQERTVELA